MLGIPLPGVPRVAATRAGMPFTEDRDEEPRRDLEELAATMVGLAKNQAATAAKEGTPAGLSRTHDRLVMIARGAGCLRSELAPDCSGIEAWEMLRRLARQCGKLYRSIGLPVPLTNRLIYGLLTVQFGCPQDGKGGSPQA